MPPGPDNPLGTRWMGLSAPGVGIHGTDDPSSIGYSASHGCIRMQVPDAEWLFDHVDDRHDGVHRLMAARVAQIARCRSSSSRAARAARLGRRAQPRPGVAAEGRQGQDRRRAPTLDAAARRHVRAPEPRVAARQGGGRQLLAVVLRAVHAGGAGASPQSRRAWKDKGVVFVGVDVQDLAGPALAFMKRFGIDVPDRQRRRAARRRATASPAIPRRSSSTGTAASSRRTSSGRVSHADLDQGHPARAEADVRAARRDVRRGRALALAGPGGARARKHPSPGRARGRARLPVMPHDRSTSRTRTSRGR